LGSIGAAYAVGATGSAAIGVIAEKPETFGRVLIFVGLAEGVAIYGLIIAFMVLR
jgi:V/A-type H+-transporting ATPase subunit K